MTGIVALGATGAFAQSLKGESGLIGIKLYDTGTRLVSIYGSPDDIQAVSLGGGAIGPAAGGGGGGTRGAGPGAPGRTGGTGGGMAADPFDISFGDAVLRQGVSGGGGFDVVPKPGTGGPQAAGSAGGGGPVAAGAAGGGGGGRGGMGGGATGGAGDKIVFTRWVYKRGGSRYGFVLDKFNRVVQIEAVGLANPKVKTSTGITFGASFATLIKTYGAPDGYELAGDHLMVRYLVRNKVAFRLSRLGEDKPHVVTGIVVAGGKT